MKRSKQVVLWITGTLAMTGCHQQPDGSWAWGSPATSGTNSGHGGYGGSGWHWSGGRSWGEGFSEGFDGVARGGFGSHGGFGGE